MITEKLGRKVLEFVKTNQFESSLATDMLASVVASVTYATEMKKAEELDASASWFVSLAAALLGTTSENYIQHKGICIEMIDLLVNCKSSVAYSGGALGLWNSLYTLSRVYPENTYFRSKMLSRPLKEWVPIREWARLYNREEVKMAWNIPNERGRAVIEEILNKFFFPTMDLVKTVHVDRWVILIPRAVHARKIF
ncbi:unnamed protein product [Cylicostephanus goldi]|uniref:Proteasome activator Blm10 middle HEAT repeats region domain-containing protein n=1 Tax=Cylicostephanus goldi TaxID=71465 RepID=A0A3P6R0Z2_CYLGO|nr:unnamed protein product [Cylicostephanus goldi]